MSWLVVVSVAAYQLIAVAVIVAARVISRRSTVGRRPNGSWEEGRNVRDMTLVGKMALVITFVSFLGVAALSASDSQPWSFICMP